MQEDDLHAKPVIGEFPFVRLGMMFSFEKLGHTVIHVQVQDIFHSYWSISF
jgi:hypothetical protein